MSMEELTLSEAETRALLLSPLAHGDPLRQVLRSGNRLHGHDPRQHRGHGKRRSKKLRELPVYPYPADHAREQGELDVYRASFRANVSCKDAIEAAIRDNYRDNRPGRWGGGGTGGGAVRTGADALRPGGNRPPF